MSVIRLSRLPMFGLPLLLVLSTSARGSYVYTNVADSSGPLAQIDDVVINDASSVAFNARTDVGAFGVFVASSTGGSVVTVATDTQVQGRPGLPSMNDLGAVVFGVGRTDGSTAIYAGAAGQAPRTVVESGGQFGFVSDAAINNAGTVVFTTGSSSGLGVYATDVDRGPNGPFTRLFQTREALGRGAPSINNAGAVTFRASFNVDGVIADRIVGAEAAGAPFVLLIADESGPLARLGSTSVNDLRMVAFDGGLDTGGSNIFIARLDEGVPMSFVDSGGAFRDFSAPSLNNLGMMAFLANLDDGGQGIFTGPDPIADKVIAVGDELFGSNVAALAFDPGGRGLNDSGDVAFTYRLADGRQGVAVASVPEPDATGLLSLAYLCLCRRRRF